MYAIAKGILDRDPGLNITERNNLLLELFEPS